MRRILQRIHSLKNDLYVLYLAFKNPHTPSLAKIIVGLMAAYTVSPVDLVPDFVPFLGYVDEMIVVPLLLSVAYRLIPAPILEECRRLAVKSPLRRKLWLWAGIIFILLAWLVLTIYLAYWYYSQ